jgi:hypothetical protein
MKRPLLLPLAAALIVAGMFVVPHHAAADVGPPTEPPRINDKRCTTAQGRLTNTADTLQAVSERQATTYGNLHERSTARIAVLKQKGYGTAPLESSLQTLDAQIKDYRAKAATLHGQLVATRDLACGDNEAAYNNSLNAARAQLRTVREASQAIHQTLGKDVVSGLKAGAAWLKKK